MIDEKLQALNRDIDTANEALQISIRALEEDKRIREKSFVARIVGAVWLTPAKRAVREAEASLSSVRGRVHGEVATWVQTSAIQAINNDSASAAEWEQCKGRVTALTDRRNKVATWFHAADNAYTALLSAERQCRSAATMDTIDAFCSENKLMDAMAYSETSSARSAANHARQAVGRLMEISPKNVESFVSDAPDGTLGLMVGLCDMPVFDLFLELDNASKLSKVADQCHFAAGQLAPMHARLKAMLTDSDAALASASGKLGEFELVFLQTAYAAVPESIRGAMPTSI